VQTRTCPQINHPQSSENAQNPGTKSCRIQYDYGSGKNVYPVEVKYEESLASLFMGYDDDELATANTNMCTLLDYELNASMEM